MNIARFAVTRPVAVSMRVAALVLLGIVCFSRLPIDLLPKVDIPTVAISVQWPNTSPEEMESQIARPLEQAVSTVQGLKNVTSSSSLGSTFVRVQFDYGVDIDAASIDVMQSVQRAKRRFPNDPTLSEPTVFKFDPSTLPIVMYGVASDRDPIKLRDMMINDISPLIESAGGVAQVNIGGGQDRAIMIDVDPAKLQAYGLSVADISNRIRQENLSLPAGITREGSTEYSVRATGYIQSLDELRKIPLVAVDGVLVTLDQVAEVRDASRDVRSHIRVNDDSALLMTITKQTDANTVDTSARVRAAVEEIQLRYPDVQFSLVYDQSQFVESSIESLKLTVLIGASLAILVITFFLRSIRSTFIIALSIPITITATFSLIYFGGFTLNTISLSGLALATGLIVDDAIVVLENIYRHMKRDHKRVAEAAVSGTQEILMPVIASTVTVIIVFLPLLLIQGQTGQVFAQFSLVVVFSLLVSTLDATTLVPVLASKIIREQDLREEDLDAPGSQKLGKRIFRYFGAAFDRLDASYRTGLEWAIRKRVKVVGIGGLAVLAALALWPHVGREQIPQTDSGDLTVRVRLPIGTALEETNFAMGRIEQILMQDPDVETVISGAGTRVGLRGGGGDGPSHEGSAQVRLSPDRTDTTEEIVARLQEKMSAVPGVRAQVSPYDVVANILGGGGFGVSIDVFGPELAQLTAVAGDIQAALEGIPGLEGVDVAVQEATPELQWNVDREKASTLGVSFSDIAATLSASTSGQLSSYYQEAGYQYPIYVQVPENFRSNPQDLAELPVVGTERGGSPVLLGQVASWQVGTGPNEISRINRQRYISVGGRIAGRAESEVQKDIQTALASVEMPEGYYWAFGLRQQARDEEFAGLGLAVLLAIALIYMVLAAQFESLVYPLVILTSVPLCAIGMVLALFVTGRAFGLTAFIGMLMLVGIVVKNGILLVDYTNKLRARGMARDEAVLEAGPTRLRPILMTSLTAIFAMLPLAIGLGSGSEIYTPLATVVIGGLATSTLLTLFVVPSVYTLLDDLVRKIQGDDRDLSNAELVEPSVEAAEQLPGLDDLSDLPPETIAGVESDGRGPIA